MRETIDYIKEKITAEIIKIDFQNKKNKKEEYVKMTKIDYLKRLYKLLKLLEDYRWKSEKSMLYIKVINV